MPTWPGTHSLVNKCLHEPMCQKFLPVRKLLRLLVGPPLLVPTAGAICEQFADSGSFIPPRSDALPAPGRYRERRERITTSEFHFCWWMLSTKIKDGERESENICCCCLVGADYQPLPPGKASKQKKE